MRILLRGAPSPVTDKEEGLMCICTFADINIYVCLCTLYANSNIQAVLLRTLVTASEVKYTANQSAIIRVTFRSTRSSFVWFNFWLAISRSIISILCVVQLRSVSFAAMEVAMAGRYGRYRCYFPIINGDLDHSAWSYALRSPRWEVRGAACSSINSAQAGSWELCKPG